ncbi:hypothetical protein FZI85_04045 [Mycobacterium sp. CBMA293]|uniref:hypothetical protein n=1 Tax=unclassified Mycolicibacterium TaxID=2636767 RepID=UPI0012DF2979|nr:MULTISPECIES: hypothetical protein [unclassified Mycolicibacterium]MUL47107.1 hypothetical protein [Mycolicibacterium sp. CBMA 360]MUL58484.1 hypothetical protein [Mycolicibacterium sp. CBMA 335]MUL73942.1 hypothetical protein [Mycolicibacterium sp. CBMA 311]MUL93367.1 hypothetical protein [Mycolicibacterium sp. CBMA 230]MUM04583.1 hypothetical protein [Mycolicibacterium sp. CBMA 213]
MTDAGTVAVALLIVLLLAPDMSEIGVFGVSLKRRLAAAEDKASKSEAKAENLETQVQIQSARIENLTVSLAAANATAGAAANAQVHQHQYFLSGSPAERAEAEKFGAELPGKAEAFVRGEITHPAATASAPDEHKADPVLATQLIENWETLAASLDLPPSRRGARSDFLRIKVTSERAEEFQMIFDEELRFVRLARNNVAHAQPITNQELHSAVDVSTELLRILRTPPSQ